MLIRFGTLVALAIFTATPAKAGVEAVRVGIFAQACCGIGTSKEDGAAFSGEVAFSSPKFLSVLRSPRPVIGFVVATDSDATSQIYAGLEWQLDLPAGFFVSTTLGGAVHNGETNFDPVADFDRVDETNFLGCRGQFRVAGDIGRRIVPGVNASFHWAHISNAGLCSVNEGLDHIGLRVSVGF